MAVHVGRWDCPSCGTKRILGPETKCPNCGASRPANVRFYLPDDAEIVEDEKRLREARAGVDWICGHCQTQNKARDTHCISCGNERDELSEDVDLQTRTYRTGEVPTDSFAPEQTVHPLEAAAQKPSKRGFSFGRWLIAAMVVLMGGWFLLRTFPQEIAVKVKSFAWERSVQMLHLEPRTYEDWKTPSDAFGVESFRAVHHYNQVLRGYETRTRNVKVQVGTEQYVCGKRDLGNGYFEDVHCSRPIYENRKESYEEPIYDQVPVYATKYRYSVMEWIAHGQNLLRSGGKNQQASWPDKGNRTNPEEWREGEKQEKYYLIVEEPDGDQHREAVDYAFWSGLRPGQEIAAQRSFLFDMYFGLRR